MQPFDIIFLWKCPMGTPKKTFSFASHSLKNRLRFDVSLKFWRSNVTFFVNSSCHFTRSENLQSYHKVLCTLFFLCEKKTTIFCARPRFSRNNKSRLWLTLGFITHWSCHHYNFLGKYTKEFAFSIKNRWLPYCYCHLYKGLFFLFVNDSSLFPLKRRPWQRLLWDLKQEKQRPFSCLNFSLRPLCW